jgi:hypothetical protein
LTRAITALAAAAVTREAHRRAGLPMRTQDWNEPGMAERAVLEVKIAELRQEHRDLDDAIAALLAQGPATQLQAQRLKKRKLQLKDMIAKLESELYPDIIA